MNFTTLTQRARSPLLLDPEHCDESRSVIEPRAMPPKLEYSGKLVLAPMVRVSELPMRLLSMKYGADLVWGPEIVDKGLLASRIVENRALGTIDFVPEKDPSKLVWRTAPELEKSRLVFQLGSADPELAVQAAKMVAPYVSAIDLNCGCPKHFSTHSGMGSQLLGTPDRLVSILTSLVEQVGTPFDVAISVKIRVLESAQTTFDLVRRLVRTGVRCLTVHCRTPGMRPRREPAFYDQLAEIARICKDADVACLVNGDVYHRGQLQEMIDTYGVSGAMIARGAEANPSCFAGPALVPPREIGREFLDLCIKYDFNVAHMKYNLKSMVPGKDPIYRQITQAKTVEALLDAINEAAPTTATAAELAEPKTAESMPATGVKRSEPFGQAAPPTKRAAQAV